MDLTRTKGPAIRWADIERRRNLERELGTVSARRKKTEIGKELEALDNALDEVDMVVSRELRFNSRVSGIDFDESYNPLIVGIIDFSDSSHPDQRGIWSVRPGPGYSPEGAPGRSADHLPYVNVKLRPGGPGGEDAEGRGILVVDVISRLVDRLLGE